MRLLKPWRGRPHSTQWQSAGVPQTQRRTTNEGGDRLTADTGMAMSVMRGAAWWAAACFLAVASCGVRVDAQCDFQQIVAEGVYYDIASPNYPSYYPAGANCRWRATSAAGTLLKLSCGEINMPQTSGCQQDRLLVSPTGDDTLSDAHTYCGYGSFSIVSEINKLTMVLQASYSSPGGRFLCNITAIPATSCRCGIKKQTRIVGGTETGINEYPFMAALVDADRRAISCGATIIGYRYALTAAHCGDKNLNRLGLLVGDHDITIGWETSASKLYTLQSFIKHPWYNVGTTVDQDNDIALVRTVDPIVMSREVMPACLPFLYRTFSFASQLVEVTGWGTLSYGGEMSNTLQKADLFVQTPAQCTGVYGAAVSERQMCTYNEGKDACQSDSGGPLFWRDPKTGLIHVVGIVSHGIACATTSPGVNTRVTSYLDWIIQNSPDERYCVH